MLPTAHIACALVINRLAGLDRGLVPAVLGSLVPDAIDKTLAWVLDAVPASRHIGHTPFAAGLATIGASTVFGRRKGLALGAAYLAHLVADLWHGGHVPWLMPFRRYRERGRRWHVRLSGNELALELAGAVVILLMLRAATQRTT